MCHEKIFGPLYWEFKCLVLGCPFLSLTFSAIITLRFFFFLSQLSLVLYKFIDLFFSYVPEVSFS